MVPPSEPGRILDVWPVPGNDEILVVPVGGIGRIGMNWTLYGHAGRWILVDAGVAFPDDRSGGAEAIVPDIADLQPIAGRLAGLLVTHAHEDHIGAIHRLWGNRPLDCPIHATPFAMGIIRHRLEEAGLASRVRLNTFTVSSSFRAGPFNARSIALTHSAPEPVAFALSCRAGTILHTGDWKLDPDPLIGSATDMDAIRSLGDQGLLALVCDSTNADRDLPISSEAQVASAYEHLFADRRGAVVVCCFGSNVARIASAARAAGLAGRCIAVTGRSMMRSEAVARSLGMLPDESHFLTDMRHMRQLDRHEIVVCCTGSQGEENAALARFARGASWLRLGVGDTVVVSARTIPGNEETVGAILRALQERGVDILTGNDLINGHPLHVSGHAGRQEIEALYRAARPRFAIPVHGTDDHLAAHTAIASNSGAVPLTPSAPAEVISISRTSARNLGRLRIGTTELMSENRQKTPTRPAPAMAMA